MIQMSSFPSTLRITATLWPSGEILSPDPVALTFTRQLGSMDVASPERDTHTGSNPPATEPASPAAR
jgi:hypothetical protein